jgi:hypothetical protein
LHHDDDGNGCIDVSTTKLSQTIASNSIPGLEVESFESIWTTRSDSSVEEATPTLQEVDDPATEGVVYSGVESSPSFEVDLSLVLQETFEKLPELDVNDPNDIEEKGLEIGCSDSVVEEGLPTPPIVRIFGRQRKYCGTSGREYCFATTQSSRKASFSGQLSLQRT